jgi:hypothetical protein
VANPFGTAPVCNVNPPTPPPAANAPFIPAFVQPNIQDPQSIIAAIQQLQYALLAITGNVVPNNVPDQLPINNVAVGNPPPGNRVIPGGGGGVGHGSTSTKSPKVQQSRFIELSRTNKTTKVSNPQDSSQFVMVKQVAGLTLRDKVTGETWVWKQ